MDLFRSVLFGIAVGDALGVPVEFMSRKEILKDPVIDMFGYGTYNQPPGTWSDDSSLAFCLADALLYKTSDDISEFPILVNQAGYNFREWLNNNFWTARGKVFDVGMTTVKALTRLSHGESPLVSGEFDESSNGNGSLMRILPLIFYTKNLHISERWSATKVMSSITHAHIYSVISCFYYLEFARQLIEGVDKFQVYENLKKEITSFLESLDINPLVISKFDRLLKQNIYELNEDYIDSSGYVLHTLEASIWCLLNTDNYREAVLKAVNLGRDTDTTGAVTGGLAGILYRNIPIEWMEQIARYDDINVLSEELKDKYKIIL